MKSLFTAVLLTLTPLSARAAGLEPLPEAPALHAKEVSLGKSLFFDFRLAGDASTSCTLCHDPASAFTDGLALSDGYPSTLYFRNSPTLYNTAFKKNLYWDGRFPGNELEGVIRDHLSEAHFMNADGRLLVERLRQIPEYTSAFREIYGKEPDYGHILSAITSYVRSLVSQDAPIDRYLRGDRDALSVSAGRGMTLFTGKAGCVRCHGGPMFSDGLFHDRQVPEHPENLREPRRQITFRRFLRTLGVEGPQHRRRDPGLYAVTKAPEDMGKFNTPSLREVERTAPYMHNGTFATLKDAAAFEAPMLDDGELNDLVEFLRSLGGTQAKEEPPILFSYAARVPETKDWTLSSSIAPPSQGEKTPRPLGPLPAVPVPADNPITPEKVRLGQMLFFDTRISGNRENSCSTCHNPEMGWGDDYDIAHGYLGTQHWRNSQTLLNAAYYTKFNWDGSRVSLEDQAEEAILSNISANGDPAMIEERLAQAPIYFQLFSEVFGSDRPHFQDLIKAIAAFVRTVPISRNVPFDAFAKGQKDALSSSALRGLRLFEGTAGCIRCHNGPMFSDEDYHATGVPANPALETDPLKQVTLRFKLSSNGVPEEFYRGSALDPGLYLITKRDTDIGKFRTQGLRELRFTRPYMHNGMLPTLADVVEFYDKGGGETPNKSDLLKPLHLTVQEKEDLIAFLESLSGDPVPAKAPLLPGYPGATHK